MNDSTYFLTVIISFTIFGVMSSISGRNIEAAIIIGSMPIFTLLWEINQKLNKRARK